MKQIGVIGWGSQAPAQGQVRQILDPYYAKARLARSDYETSKTVCTRECTLGKCNDQLYTRAEP
jgi:hypothetical protein